MAADKEELEPSFCGDVVLLFSRVGVDALRIPELLDHFVAVPVLLLERTYVLMTPRNYTLSRQNQTLAPRYTQRHKQLNTGS